MKILAILFCTAALVGGGVQAMAQAASGSADAKFKAIYTEEWNWRRTEMGGGRGAEQPMDHLPRVDRATQDNRLKHWSDALAAVVAIPPDQLSPAERINQAVYRMQLETLVADQTFKLYEMPFNSDTQFWSSLASGARRPFRSAEEYQAYIARLNDMPRYFQDETVNMRAGLARGFSVPRETLVGRDGSILDAADPAKPEDNPFFQPFKSFPKSIPADEQASLRAAGLKAVQASVIPAHQKLLAFYRDEYLPHARTTLAAEAMPDGKAFYRSQIKEYTSLDLSPEEIHEMGLKEVARIHAEMLATMQASGFKGSFPEFLQFLRTDPRFYAKTGDELLMRAAWISKKQDGKIGRYIGHLSRERFGIDPVPLSIAPFYTSGRGGADVCLMNTYDLPSRPLYNLTALVLHECSPGHSLQGQIANELQGLPAFRRSNHISAYGEGWALYVEKLGREMGMYETPYDEFGRETFEMWRACRLVVDTGIHHYGWTRQQAIDYLKTNTALATHDIEIEVDRYITWPGQALAYKLGEMDIERMRAKAETALGPKFDIRAFNDALLVQGSVPLPVLNDEIERYIASGGKDPFAGLADSSRGPGRAPD